MCIKNQAFMNAAIVCLVTLHSNGRRWIGGHSIRNPVKISRHSGEYRNMGWISTTVATTEANNTNLDVAINKKRTATDISLSYTLCYMY